MKATVDKFYAENPEIIVWTDVEFLRNSFNSLSAVVKLLATVEESFKQPQSGEGSVLMETVSYVKGLVMLKAEEFQQWLHSYHTGNF